MANDKEEKIIDETCHMFLALFRGKDNKDFQRSKAPVIRQIIGSEPSLDLDILYAKIRRNTNRGIWRIYVTVNSRNKRKALNLFVHKIIDLHSDKNSEICIDSVWKSCLLQPECRADKFFLLDIDSEKAYAYVENALRQELIKSVHMPLNEAFIKTPNGWHLVTEPFDIRILKCEGLELKRDGYLFVELINTSQKT
jgi:hypothetical protein